MFRLAAAALAALFIFVADADAQAVYRCVEKGKPVSFQTEPCAPTATISKIREFTPDRELTPRERQHRDAQWATRPRGQAASGGAVGHQIPQGRSSTVTRCAIARQQRDQWERTVGLKRSYDAVRAMNDMVARACN